MGPKARSEELAEAVRVDVKHMKAERKNIGPSTIDLDTLTVHHCISL